MPVDQKNIVSKMSWFTHTAAKELCTWLKRRMPRDGGDWWQDMVLDNLSQSERLIVQENHYSKLDDLDLAMLLRVTDKNWNYFAQPGSFWHSDRECVKEMIRVRNRWAHPSAELTGKDAIIQDLATLNDFFDFVMPENTYSSDIASFRTSVANMSFAEPAPQAVVVPTVTVSESDSGIHEKDEVYPVSDPDARGLVVSIVESGGHKEYSVFINNGFSTFYEGQIRKVAPKAPYTEIDKDTLLSRLTAYEINHPSAGSLYSMNAAKIDYVPYQFRPVLKLIRSDEPRILIADSVGVGKTIEAGLIIKELEARSDLEKVLIICPKPLVAERKWELEMKRFEENDFVTLDKQLLTRAIEDCHLDETWPHKYNKAIIPYSVLDSTIYENLAEKEWHRGHMGLDPAPHFDLVIIDEAHHIRKGTMMKDKAFQYKCIHYLCEHASAVVMLTATPLQTDDDDLFTLLNLLRPDLILDKEVFAMMMRPNQYIYNCSCAIRSGAKDWARTAIDELKKVTTTDWGENVIARNPLYEDILSRLANCIGLTDKDRERQERVSLAYDVESLHTLNNMLNRTRRKDIEMNFCTRRSYTVSVKFTERQRELHDALLNFEEFALNKIHNRGVKFMMSTIRRQASSCIFALAPYVNDLIERRMDRIDLDFDDDDLEIRDVVFTGEELLAMLAEKLLTLSKDLPEEDPKFDKIIEIIEEKQKQQNNKIILFSTFRRTLDYLEDKLKKRGYRVAQVHGGIRDEERRQLTNRFRMDKNDPDALDILLFTEVGSEGLDYQFCDTMINYDLPWNPMKIEQRIGRIDRRGQKSEVVHIYNVITEDTVDAEIYERCLLRIGIFERSIGECEAILADMSKELNTIASGELTDEERQKKLQQLADNEVRQIQEEARREEDEKALFGFSFARTAHAKDLKDAESLWVSPQAIRRLIVRYFADRLGDKEVFSGKQMQLGKESKQALLEDYRKLPKSSSSVYAAWAAYLKDYSADKRWHQVAFTPEDADVEPKPFFFTPTHPLVKQAARHFSDSSESFVRLTCISDTLPAGVYPFSLYGWTYKGLSPRYRVVPICEDPEIGSEFGELLQFAESSAGTDMPAKETWEKLDGIQYTRWQSEKEKYLTDIRKNADYKLESLKSSFGKRRATLESQIREAENAKLRRMFEGELEKARAQYERKTEEIRQRAESADIHTANIAHGVIEIRRS